MPELLARLRLRFGDFWFYTMMLFVAMRLTDILNAFVGLWLVPKYVGPSELGAVLPLVQFANFIALPVAAFALVFMKEVCALATHGAYGQMKSLMRGVFVGAGIFLVLAVLISNFVLPHFLERIRIVKGSLGILVIAAGFLGAIAPVYGNALQAMKRFHTMSAISLLGAPLRFVAMLITMPFRALSGYFVGQIALPVFNISAAVFCLRRELSAKAEPYWSRDVLRRFGMLWLAVTANLGAGALLGLVEQTILRQRLPDVDSAAYYMLTRFAEIAGFLATTLNATLFPYTAEQAERGKSTRPLLLRASLGMVVFSCALALFFALFGGPILRLLPNGDQYAEFAWALPWLIGITSLLALQTFHTNTEVSAGRFGFLKWWIPVNLLFAALMLGVSGYGHFAQWLPAGTCEFLACHNITTLHAALIWLSADALIKLAFCANDVCRRR